MVKTTLTHDRSQAGFTLVELAIVMIIIGLLIGGILKGQELIANAQITATAAQVKAVESAMTTFRDSYNAVPGDMANPGARLPNCGVAPCSTAGNGNNRVDGAGLAEVAGANENSRFWTHLAAADMIGGVSSTSTVIDVWGEQLPSAEVAGGFVVAFASGAVTGALDTTMNAGHYLNLRLTPAAQTATENLALSQTQAARIDRKLDDGLAISGGTVGVGGATCANAAGVYAEATSTIACSLYIRVQ